MLWKFRNEVIFGLALAFAVKAIVHPDIASVAGLVLFLSAHYVDRFFSSERAEEKVVKRIADFEGEIKVIKDQVTRIALSVGIRGGK